MRRVWGIARRRIKAVGHLTGRRRMDAAAAAVVAAMILVYGSSMLSFAKGTERKEACKYYMSISVEKGDTLWSIAEEYMTEEYEGIEEYIQELRSLNRICGDRIYAGEYLAIPCFGTEAP